MAPEQRLMREMLNTNLRRFSVAKLKELYSQRGHGIHDVYFDKFMLRITFPNFPGASIAPLNIFYEQTVLATGRFDLSYPDVVNLEAYPSLKDGNRFNELLTKYLLELPVMSTDVVGNDILKVDFKGILQQVNLYLVAPTRGTQPPGNYQWPVGDFLLDVRFPNNPNDPAVPLALLRDGDKRIASCLLDTAAHSVHDIEYPSVDDMIFLGLHLKELLGGVESYRDKDITRIQEPEPPMILTNMADINDEWIEWFRKDNPGTSYAKAVHAALAQIDLEVKNRKKILDKYAITRY